jgi:antitoxin component of MazEF toxin-antitoxin module
MAVLVRTKKWGNSIGIIIPSETVEKLNIKPEEKISVEISKEGNVLEEMFGTMKSKKTAKQIVDEARKEFFESKWMK